jgi:hypothetical protein
VIRAVAKLTPGPFLSARLFLECREPSLGGYSAPTTLKSLLTKMWCGQLTPMLWTSYFPLLIVLPPVSSWLQRAPYGRA